MATTGNNHKYGPIKRIFKAASKIEPNELRATLLSFCFLFSLMLAYNILKPVRDAMASDWSAFGVATVWTINLVFSAVAVSIYGFAVSRVKFKNLVLSVYAFFGASFLAFYFGSTFVENTVYIDKAYYLWISVFSLFHISVFWSLMSDVFSKDQAPRLFAFIQSGASIGALAGSFVAIALARIVGSLNLLLIAALLLAAIIPVIGVLQRLKVTELGNENVHVDLSRQQKIGGNPFAGFTLFLKNPYLLGIGIFILLYTSVGSFVHLELLDVLARFDLETRATIWAAINGSINIITIATAMFVTSRITTRFGLARTLAAVPFLVAIGLLAIAVLAVAVAPAMLAIVAVWVLLKAGNYSITRPGREMLYTVVDRESRFKAKPVIDIVVYRGGDAVTGWAFAGLTTGLGLGLGVIAAIGAGIAAIWAVVGVYLGRSYHRTAAAADATPVPVEE